MNDEHIVVDGLKLVYTVSKATGALLVRMPGRTTETVESLRSKGCIVTMPKILRTNDFT